MNDSGPLLKDIHRFNDTMNALDLATADRRFEQLIERRERIIERSRFGLLALNGASLIGTLANLSAIRELGIDPRIAIGFFAAGMVAGLISIALEINHLAYKAGQAMTHLSHLRLMRANLDSSATDDAHKLLGEQLEELVARSQREWTMDAKVDSSSPAIPSDFSYSTAAVYAFNASGGAWIGGAAYILSALVGL